jgi:hypothetical protein
MEKLGNDAHVAVEVALGPLGHALAAPANKHVLGQARVCVLDLDKRKLNLAVGQVLDHVNQLALAGRLDLEHAFLAGVWLEGIGERGLDGEDCPLAIGGRVCGRTSRERSVDDLLVGGGDGHAVAGGVERGHGGREDSLQWGRGERDRDWLKGVVASRGYMRVCKRKKLWVWHSSLVFGVVVVWYATALFVGPRRHSHSRPASSC